MRHPTLPVRALALVGALLALPGVASASSASPSSAAPSSTTTASVKPAGRPTAADARAFVERVNADLKRLYVESGRAEWVKENFITDDTEILAADASEKLMTYQAQAIKEAARFNGVTVDADTARALLLLRVSADLPAPADAAKTKELAEIASKLTGIYGKGKYCNANLSKAEKKFDKDKDGCLDLEELDTLMGESRDYDTLQDAWNGWHTVSPPMRPMYERYVALSNEGARELGFSDVGAMWRERYDMPADAFSADVERLWGQVKPLYDDLHCYVRNRLAQSYKGKVSTTGPIPAFVLGNMWAQEWSNVYPLVEPFHGQASLDVDRVIEAQFKSRKLDEKKMVALGESFFTSLGFDKLPDTFWKRSLITKPRDRDVVCHASAWDVTYDADLRIKMCVKPTEEDLITVHHELGHIFYFQSYYKLPALYQQGANDGFHEAIGDTIALSITPEYLQKVGLLGKVTKNEKALINQQMKIALDKIAFLPFGLLMDKWRWDVFSGKTPASEYNKHWWELRTKYQGITPVSTRDETHFDPGAKFHIPANVPYARYFLSFVMQFQFHKALCDAAGFKGPLHECSIYGNAAAGAKLKQMLALGASKPWPEAMAALTGGTRMDGAAIVDYFAPLRAWLQEQNKGQTCGW